MEVRTGEGRSTGWAADPRFARFVRLFNARRFFEAHEVLEDLWLVMRGRERPLVQGLIQIAVALEHRRRGNDAGARKVLRSASKRLAPFGEREAGVAIGRLQRSVATYLDQPPGRSAPPSFPEQARGIEDESRSTGRDQDTMSKAPKGRPSRMKPRAQAAANALGARRKAPARKTATRDTAARKPAVQTAARKVAVQTAAKGGASRKRDAGPSAARAPRRGPVRLEPLEARRGRALAILAGLRTLYPEARCELGHASALELLVATILSAQCTDRRVNMTTPSLFARYRTAGDYAGADPAEVEALIRPTGFYRNKTKSILALGKALVERHGGEVPETMDELVALPGVGRKTANVLIAEWYGRPGIAVDTHVIRLTGPIWRLTDETDPVKIEFALYALIPEPDRAFFGIATIHHGRRVCPARTPRCGACELAPICPSAFRHASARAPLKVGPAARAGRAPSP